MNVFKCEWIRRKGLQDPSGEPLVSTIWHFLELCAYYPPKLEDEELFFLIIHFKVISTKSPWGCKAENKLKYFYFTREEEEFTTATFSCFLRISYMYLKIFNFSFSSFLFPLIPFLPTSCLLGLISFWTVWNSLGSVIVASESTEGSVILLLHHWRNSFLVPVAINFHWFLGVAEASWTSSASMTEVCWQVPVCRANHSSYEFMMH